MTLARQLFSPPMVERLYLCACLFLACLSAVQIARASDNEPLFYPFCNPRLDMYGYVDHRYLNAAAAHGTWNEEVSICERVSLIYDPRHAKDWGHCYCEYIVNMDPTAPSGGLYLHYPFRCTFGFFDSKEDAERQSEPCKNKDLYQLPLSWWPEEVKQL